MRNSRYNKRPRGGQDSELQRAASKLTLPSFDARAGDTITRNLHEEFEKLASSQAEVSDSTPL